MAVVQVSCAKRLPPGIRVQQPGDVCLDAIRPVPYVRWELDAMPLHDKAQQTRFGGFLSNVDQFDAGLFGISKPEAELMDPQQRLLLEVGGTHT